MTDLNELTEVRALFDDPPAPSAQVVAAARRRMAEDGRSERRPWRLQAGLAGLTAAAAAVTLAVATLGGGGSEPPRPEQPGATENKVGGNNILLAAAAKAEREQVGRYYRTRTVAEPVVYAAPGGYVVARKSESDEWAPRSISDAYVAYHRPLGIGPATGADQAAWRKAGSPRKFRVRTADDPRTITLAISGPGEWETFRTTGAERKRLCKCDVEPWMEREKLASAPGGLERLLFPEKQKQARLGDRPLRIDPANRLLGSYDVLTEAASPKVRAAVFRLLAGQPGITMVDGVRDMRGRTGVALVGRGTTIGGAGGVFDVQLIIDPKTYQVLGKQYVVVTKGGRFPGVQPGAVVERHAVLEAGWTNESPHH
ncbi:hypothetical protein [Actinomadura rudentiformis]|uniref:CU044_5270 family protein n=1 Tax=Actinomadura rudentiformis TaxID=359158 RepID=A0A6H9YNE5_9ACTN|nr:hypothetical protein [Actinomadura rudentiformis]KAB2348494.1 hypothetical protein F8566_17075 [Actinomadura rudentiformis]